MVFPPGESSLSLDEVVNQWAEEEGGQYLYGAPGGLILHLQRSVMIDGLWTKHARELDVPTNVNIPFPEDGVHVHMANYKVASVILHLGQGHENGHYVAIHAMDNAYWVADDDSYPVPVAPLRTTQKRGCSALVGTRSQWGTRPRHPGSY